MKNHVTEKKKHSHRKRRWRSVSLNSVLCYLRIAEGLSRTALAMRCKMLPYDILRWEQGHRGMKVEKLMRLAEYFGVPEEALYYNRFDLAVSSRQKAIPRDKERWNRKLERKARAEKIGLNGECLAEKCERERLAGTPFANGVSSNVADCEKYGCDLLSFTLDGEPLFIEVKTASGEEDTGFEITACELEFAEYCLETGTNYILKRITNAGEPGKEKVRDYTAEELLNEFTFTPCAFKAKRRETA